MGNFAKEKKPMKKTWILACTLLFASVAGFADSPSPGPVSDEVLAAILGEPLAGAACPTAAGGAGEMRLASVVQNEKTCTASVTCLDGSTRSCMSGSTDCVAVNPNCSTSLEPGHVTCSGVTTNCPACCTGMGMIGNACCRCDITGSCMDCCRCDGGSVVQCSLACG
jgi:hypothetical protein